jgi:sulfate permease, SulP family
LTLGIATGVTLGAFLFLHRMAESIEVREGGVFLGEDQADESAGEGRAYDPDAAADPDFMVYKISGAFFFGATAAVNAALDRIGKYPRTFVFDFGDVPMMDITAARALKAFVRKLRRAGTTVFVTRARRNVRRTLLLSGLRKPEVLYARSALEARQRSSESLPS